MGGVFSIERRLKKLEHRGDANQVIQEHFKTCKRNKEERGVFTKIFRSQKTKVPLCLLVEDDYVSSLKSQVTYTSRGSLSEASRHEYPTSEARHKYPEAREDFRQKVESLPEVPKIGREALRAKQTRLEGRVSSALESAPKHGKSPLIREIYPPSPRD